MLKPTTGGWKHNCGPPGLERKCLKSEKAGNRRKYIALVDHCTRSSHFSSEDFHQAQISLSNPPVEWTQFDAIDLELSPLLLRSILCQAGLGLRNPAKPAWSHAFWHHFACRYL